MSISLHKGQKISLTKDNPTVDSLLVGLGWKARESDGEDFDLDASCFLLKANDRVRNDGDLVFYGNLVGPNEAVVHTGDDRSGGDGANDDEIINVELSRVPPTIEKLCFVVSIYDAEKRHQNFGMIRNAYIRVVDKNSNKELLRYDLSEDASCFTAMIFGFVYREGAEWKFKAEGTGIDNGLAGLCNRYGIEVED